VTRFEKRAPKSWNTVEQRVRITILINKCLTISFKDSIFSSVQTMIAGRSIQTSFTSQVIDIRLSTPTQFASLPEQSGDAMPRSATERSRKGMKGGEH